jgi:hypothetical protein
MHAWAALKAANIAAYGVFFSLSALTTVPADAQEIK